MTKELKKVGFVYCTFEQLQNKLMGRLMWHKNEKKEISYNWTIETNLGINFLIEKTIKNLNNKNYYYWPIFGYNAAALEKFKIYTKLNYLSLREYESLKGGSPYQVFK